MISFLVRLLKKFQYAFEGILHGLLHDRSIQIQFVFAFITIALTKFVFRLNTDEMLFVYILIALVLAFEYINSSIEKLTDAVFMQQDERAKHIKDYAAAAVLIVAIVAAIIAFIIIF